MTILGMDMKKKYINFSTDGRQYVISFDYSYIHGIRNLLLYSGNEGDDTLVEGTYTEGYMYPPLGERLSILAKCFFYKCKYRIRRQKE